MRKLLCYYKSNLTALSVETYDEVLKYVEAIKHEKVELPVSIFDFGRSEVRNKVKEFLYNYVSEG